MDSGILLSTLGTIPLLSKAASPRATGQSFKISNVAYMNKIKINATACSQQAGLSLVHISNTAYH